MAAALLLQLRLLRALALWSLLLLHGPWPVARAQTVEQTRLEAAMTLRMLSFVSWPDEGGDEEGNGKLIRIAVFEDNAKLLEFERLLQDEDNAGRYTVRSLGIDASNAELGQIDALVFGDSASRDTARMLRRLEGMPVVLIGSFEGFLEIGGMVKFTRQARRLGFDIDASRARAHGIEFRAKLLRLANRVIGA